jgi:beta-lactam-binding protein with PASTA domain
VPACTGLDEPTARARIGDAGLIEGTITKTADERVPVGQVVACRPATDTQVRRGTAVDLVVSSGPAPVTVPEVRGRTADQADRILRGRGLGRGATTFQADENVRAGLILESLPAAGESVARDSTVDLVVSSGRPDRAVPPLNGLTLAEAFGALHDARLRPGRLADVDDLLEAGRVVHSTPDAGTPVAADSAVDLSVSTGPVVVPDIAVMTLADARTAVEGAGLIVVPGVVDEEGRPLSDREVNSLVRTDPPAGSLKPRGTRITIVGRPAPLTLAPQTSTPPPPPPPVPILR